MKIKEQIGALTALVLIILVNGWVLQRWVVRDTRPPAWDQAIHISLAYEYQDRIENEGVSGVLKKAYFNYPPLYHLLMIPALSFVESPNDVGGLLNFFFLAFLILIVYAIARNFFNPWKSVIAAGLISAYPIIAEMSREPMLDVALTMWVSLAVLCLIQSEGFQKPIWSLGVGVSIGLGLLTKWTMAVYVFGPLIFALIGCWRTRKWFWFFLAMGLAFAISAPWYLSNLFPVLAMLKRVAALTPAGGVVLPVGLGWLWYPVNFPTLLHLPFLLLFIPGIFIGLWRPKYWPIVSWIACGLLILYIIVNSHNVRYAMPVLPAVAILSCSWIPDRLWARWSVALVTIAYFCFFHFAPSTQISIPISHGTVSLFGNMSPQTGDWQHQEIIKKVEVIKSSGTYTNIVTVSNHPLLHSKTLDLSVKKMGIKNMAFRGVSKKRWFDFSEFVLYKTGDLGPTGTAEAALMVRAFIEDPAPWFIESYNEVGRWPLPDGSEAVLLKTHPIPLPSFQDASLNLELDRMDFPNIALENVSFLVTPVSPRESAIGKFSSIKVSAKLVNYKGVVFENVECTFEEPHLNLPRFSRTQELQLFSLESLMVNADIPLSSLENYAREKLDDFSHVGIDIVKDSIGLRLSRYGLTGQTKLNLTIQNKTLITQLEKLKINGVPLPKFMFRGLTDYKYPLTAHREMPFNLKIKKIIGENEKFLVRSN